MPNEFLDVPEQVRNNDLLLPEVKEDSMALNLPNDNVKVKSINPIPGFCMKVLDYNNAKIFINVCHSQEIPEPDIISEEDLSKILESDEPSSYRVPMSIGEAHQEKDKNGKDCTCYDVIINTKFFEWMDKSELFKTFVTSLTYESVQDKYKLNIQVESCVILKNKPYFGIMPKHYIREKPLIAELGSGPLLEKKVPNVSSSIKKDAVKNIPLTPEFVLRRKPAMGDPLELFLDVHLPGVVTGETIAVHVGEDQIFVYERTKKFELNPVLPFPIQSHDCEAEFDVSKKVLSVTMPVDVNKL